MFFPKALFEKRKKKVFFWLTARKTLSEKESVIRPVVHYRHLLQGDLVDLGDCLIVFTAELHAALMNWYLLWLLHAPQGLLQQGEISFSPHPICIASKLLV